MIKVNLKLSDSFIFMPLKYLNNKTPKNYDIWLRQSLENGATFRKSKELNRSFCGGTQMGN